MRPDTFFSEYGYLLQRLIQRDFRRRYHHSYLGILWSVVAPLLQFVSMRFIFLHLVGRNTPHYSTFLFAGLIVYNYFAESTKTGMTALVQNRTILEKIDVPHVLFLLSKTCAVFLNFVLTLLVFFVLARMDGIRMRPMFVLLIVPSAFLFLFSFAINLVLSVIYVYFRDTSYLYDVFLIFLRYASAIFYDPALLPESFQALYIWNPVYLCIHYFRSVVIDNALPPLSHHLILAGYVAGMLFLGASLYRAFRSRLVYHL